MKLLTFAAQQSSASSRMTLTRAQQSHAYMTVAGEEAWWEAQDVCVCVSRGVGGEEISIGVEGYEWGGGSKEGKGARDGYLGGGRYRWSLDTEVEHRGSWLRRWALDSGGERGGSFLRQQSFTSAREGPWLCRRARESEGEGGDSVLRHCGHKSARDSCSWLRPWSLDSGVEGGGSVLRQFSQSARDGPSLCCRSLEPVDARERGGEASPGDRSLLHPLSPPTRQALTWDLGPSRTIQQQHAKGVGLSSSCVHLFFASDRAGRY